MNTRSQAQANLLGFLKGDTDLLLVISKCKSNSYWDQCYSSLQLSDCHFREMVQSPKVKKDIVGLLRQQYQIVSPLSSVVNQQLSKFESTRVGPRNFFWEKYTEYECAMKLAKKPQIMDVHRTFQDKVTIATRVILHITFLTKLCLEPTKTTVTSKQTKKIEHTPDDIWKIVKLLRPYLSIYSSKLLRTNDSFEKQFDAAMFCSIFAGEMSVEQLMQKNSKSDSGNKDDIEAVLAEVNTHKKLVDRKEKFVVKLQSVHNNNINNNNNNNNNETCVDHNQLEKDSAIPSKPSKGKRKQLATTKKDDEKKPRLFNDTAAHSEMVLALNRGEDIIEDELLDNLEVNWVDELCIPCVGGILKSPTNNLQFIPRFNTTLARHSLYSS